jgi:hypothetical protein
VVQGSLEAGVADEDGIEASATSKAAIACNHLWFLQ